MKLIEISSVFGSFRGKILDEGSLKIARSLIYENFECHACSEFSFWYFGSRPILQRARSGGVSRSDCRHVMNITTPHELDALISDMPVSVMFYMGPLIWDLKRQGPVIWDFAIGLTKKKAFAIYILK